MNLLLKEACMLDFSMNDAKIHIFVFALSLFAEDLKF